MTNITFEREERDCDYNKNPATRRKLYDFRVLIDGEYRARFSLYGQGQGYQLKPLDDYQPLGAQGYSNYAPRINQPDFMATVETFLAQGKIPTLADYEQRAADRAAKDQADRQKKLAADSLHRIEKAAPELLAALHSAIKIAGEARIVWDEAPEGMKAGKLLIALSGDLKGYRADIDAIHEVIAKLDAADAAALNAAHDLETES